MGANQFRSNHDSIGSTFNSKKINGITLLMHSNQTLVAVYDFNSDFKNQLSVRKGELVKLIQFSDDKEWCDVVKLNTPTHGWVPSSYLTQNIMSQNVVNNYLRLSELNHFPWYHGKITRQDGENLLRSGINGSYLIRHSESQPGQLSVTLRYEGRVYHYRISYNDITKKYFITDNNQFSCVENLVEYHSKFPEGLVSPLLYAVINKNNKNDINPNENWEINRSEIFMHQKLGSGQYGDVYEAVWKRYDIIVAVKTLKEDLHLMLDEFLKEAIIMKSLKHKNLVQLYGVCSKEPPYYLVTEYISQGNLLDYLRNCNRFEILPQLLIYMATQIAAGMTYLEANNYIHRDLAARNCLVGDCYSIKIGDFGLARCIITNNLYTAKIGAKFPIKWTAPESLANNMFSIKSDVWSFGVVLWELATYGLAPYPGIELHDVYRILEKGYRMECPEGCPKMVYDLMLKCWEWNPMCRPSFFRLLSNLEAIYFGAYDTLLHYTNPINTKLENSQNLDEMKLCCKDIMGSKSVLKGDFEGSLLDESGVGDSLLSNESITESIKLQKKCSQLSKYYKIYSEKDKSSLHADHLDVISANSIKSLKSNDDTGPFSTIPTEDRINKYLESLRKLNEINISTKIKSIENIDVKTVCDLSLKKEMVLKRKGETENSKNKKSLNCKILRLLEIIGDINNLLTMNEENWINIVNNVKELLNIIIEIKYIFSSAENIIQFLKEFNSKNVSSFIKITDKNSFISSLQEIFVILKHDIDYFMSAC